MKRLFDISASTFLILSLFLPLFALIIAHLLIMGRPVFFRQERARGKDGRLFNILKLRTMRNGDGTDADGLTAWGKFLRSTSLDELPELLNVLRGDMSLVGPRPLPTRYLPRYSSEQAKRHDALPGITGWAQVNGRNGLIWERQFELDLWYVQNASLLLDLKILVLTVFSRSSVEKTSIKKAKQPAKNFKEPKAKLIQTLMKPDRDAIAGIVLTP